jgi:hypothetical protein
MVLQGSNSRVDSIHGRAHVVAYLNGGVPSYADAAGQVLPPKLLACIFLL